MSSRDLFFKPDDRITLKGFNIYSHYYILYEKGLLAVVLSLLNLPVLLTTTAVSVSLDKEIAIYSGVHPALIFFKHENLNSLIQQLHTPYSILGDFNGNTILCGNKGNNSRGELIEDVITENDICFMNNKPYTYIHSPTKYSFSSMDLLLCHPSHFLDFKWSLCEDQHHSDH